MKGKKILAFVCSFILLMTQIPFSVISANEIGESETTVITLEENFVDSIIVESKVYDGTTLASVDFSNVKLVGKLEGDDVELTGTAEFIDANVGEQKAVTITNLTLQGTDAEQYIINLTEEQEEVVLSADITPRNLRLIPKETTFIKGVIPEKVPYDYAQEDVVEADKNNINPTAVLTVELVGQQYVFKINDPTATGNSNYVAVIEGSPIVNEADAPTIITDAVLTKGSAKNLSSYGFGIVADGSVNLFVSAKSDVSNLPIIFTLSDGQSVTVEKGETIVNEPGMYRYTAEFTLNIPQEKKSHTIENLSCTADNGKSSESILKFMIEGDNSTSQKIILENNKPSISKMKVKYDDVNRLFQANGTIVDKESGIKTIRFKWDNQKWEEYDVNDNNPNATIWFDDKVFYRDSENVNANNGLHTLYFEITDNAGNQYTESGCYCSLSNGPDQKAPEITYATLETVDETPLDKVLRILSFGNYTKHELKLTIVAKDTSYSEKVYGIDYVEILDGTGADARKICHIDGIQEEYCFKLDAGKLSELIIENFYIRVSDGYNVLEISLLEALRKYDKEEIETEEIETEGTGTEETTDPSVNWNEVTSNKWIFDSKSPEIVPDYDSNSPVNGVRYYGNNGGEFSITITDNIGFEKVEITQNYKSSQSDEGEDISIKLSECITINSGYKYIVDTDELETGVYTYTVSANDYAGNTSTECFQFYVDHEEPEGRIEVISPICIEIDEKQWINEKDDDGNNQDVTFRLYANSCGAKLYTITMKVNGKEFQTFTADSFKVNADTKETYVDLTINTANLKFKSDHTYVVEAEIEAESGNVGGAEFTLYVDTQNPVVNSFTVDTKNDAVANLLNVLSFGVFASDSLVFSVKVSDTNFDSGIDYVTINYDGLTAPIEMNKKSEGNYYAYLDIGTQVFQSDIVVTVHDKMGRTNDSCPNIANTDKTDEVSDSCFVMLETIEPTVIIDLPETDSVLRDDGQIWYKKHENSENDQEKLITLNVHDEDAGIRMVEMSINGIVVTPEMESNKNALPTIKSTSEAAEANCKELQYSYSLEKIAEKIPANEDGSYIVEVTAVDNAGNVNSDPVDSAGNSYSDSTPIYYRDIVNPSVVQFAFDPATSENISETEEFIEHLEYGFYFKKGFDVIVSVTDEEPSSELDKVVFCLVPYLDGAEQEAQTYEVGIAEGKASYAIPAGFKGQIYAQAYDKVGNVSDEKTPHGFVSDDVAPAITVEPLPDTTTRTDGNGNKLYAGTVQFRVTISDTQSGLKEFSYSKSSEKGSHGAVVNTIGNTDGYFKNKVLDNGWEITKTDANLITEVSKVFTFDSDDNDIIMTFHAMDRSSNNSKSVSNEAFSIDTISPEVLISNATELINDIYYRGNTVFTITVTERNFDKGLMVSTITNNFSGTVPAVTFQTSALNPNVHVATVTFMEGDFNFSFSGEDCAGHAANISYNGGEIRNSFFEMFRVDATAPVIKTNFRSFGEDSDESIYFNSEQTAIIEVVEHNFDATDMGILVQAKDSGVKHTTEDGWYDLGYFSDWIQNGDTYTLKIPFSIDGVYRISISPKDRAGNIGVFENGSIDHTPIYEIDMTAPTVTARNGQSVNSSDTKFLDVYNFERRNEASPTVEFDDINFDRLEYTVTSYTPVYTDGKELDIIKPNELLTKVQTQKKFTLSDFVEDGVYAVTITAYDKAGNASVINENTYMRMVNSDVLAYIEDSNSERKTGWYSFADTSGPISKRPDSFSDLSIVVISKLDCQSNIVLRNENEEETNTGITAKNIAEMYGVGLYRYTLPGDYFAENYAEDTDTRLYLRVNNDGKYIELGEIYIDNTLPTCDIPKNFKNWGWFFGLGSQTIVFGNVGELLDQENSVAYVDGKEVSLEFSEDGKTVSLTLEPGSYNVGISLVDRAGNTYNIPEVMHLAIGHNRLLIILGICIGGMVLTILIIKFVKKIKRKS